MLASRQRQGCQTTLRHRSGERVSDAERDAVNEIARALGVEAPGEGGGASPVAD